ncbi:DNA polymerase IV [Patulibacter defluvii]|uniref:DNA polymerase IV n=1 Tax=Patulibacter defluvii TaxID=3095358 RepID=UPI002A7657A4|nr:DNA polymerase IV [Patulibacter sp. DM4]
MATRSILHADLDAFFASVEQRDDPALRGRPVAVGPGVVMAASYEARRRGVRAGMGVERARRRCPGLVVVPSRFDAYLEASRRVLAVLDEIAPDVEQLSVDEAFLDVTGLERICGPPPVIAQRLRRTVREQVGLPISVGGGTTTQVAKLASGAAKPDGVLVIPPGRELEFLHPLPVERIWGCGPATAAKLRACGIATVAQLATIPPPALATIVGKAAARSLHAVAHNREGRPLQPRRGRRSFGTQSAVRIPAGSPERLDAHAIALAERVTRRMRGAGREGRTVVLRLRFEDYSRLSRAVTLPRPTAATVAVLTAFRGLLAAARELTDQRDLTLVGIAVTNLVPVAPRQLELPFDEDPAAAALDGAVDAVRDRYGARSLKRARLLDAGPGLAAWSLADQDGDETGRVRDARRRDARRQRAGPPINGPRG